MASPPSQVEGVQGPETTCEPAKGPDPPSPPSASPPDEEEPTLPEGFGKSFAVRDGERQGVYIYVPTEVSACEPGISLQDSATFIYIY